MAHLSCNLDVPPRDNSIVPRDPSMPQKYPCSAAVTTRSKQKQMPCQGERPKGLTILKKSLKF